MDTKKLARAARRAADLLADAPTQNKNRALSAMAEQLDANRQAILSANVADMEAAEEKGLEKRLIARLNFGETKIDSRIESLRLIADLPDPVGQTFREDLRPNGLRVARVRVPIGVVLMVYEARPHVTVNAGAFCLKAGNAAILRGGSEAAHCNALLGKMWRQALEQADLPHDAVMVISGSHETVGELLALDDLIDLVIPRGGKGLIESVARRSRIPVIKHFEGVCHVYVESSADLQAAARIAVDSKCLMPEVCNAAETLLIDEAVVERAAPVLQALADRGVRLRADEAARRAAPQAEAATEDDWRTEYLDMVMAVRTVGGVDAAIEHINTYGSHHTDAIVTNDLAAARRFTRCVDSGVVVVNASTMFCDGKSLGMGAEIGISTDRLHARGPMGLEDLTTYKFAIQGDGHTMGE